VIDMGDRVPTAETRVLGSGALAVAESDAVEPDDDAALLTRTTERRRRRGYWLLALVLVLAGLAGGTGWYFGAGPGSLAVVPETSTLMPDSATQVLEEAGFEVELAERTDPVVPQGQVSGTDPEAGAQARRGSTVQLFVSLGPQLLDVPQVVGLPEADARAQLGEFFTVVDAATPQFSGDVEAGNVIAVLDADGAGVGATYPERGELTLVVSVGPVPPVEGLAVGEAQTRLEDAQLVVEFADPVFSDDVPVDVVVTADWLDDPMNPGDTVRLTVSKGPDLVEVPNVVTGQTIAQARTQLEELGFVVSSNVPQFLEGAVVASVQSPAAGERLARGSEITVNFEP
jgi:beta-lactam-binding protein with PASTA domain